MYVIIEGIVIPQNNIETNNRLIIEVRTRVRQNRQDNSENL